MWLTFQPLGWLSFALLVTSTATKNNKTDNLLINSAVFNDVDKNYRTQDNFIQSSFMILDFDNGKVTPQAFEEIFFTKANKANKRSFVITNSFSRSKDKPNNFRVFMFYKSPVMSIQQHQIIFDDISNTLKLNGYEATTSGLDKSCRNGIQSFYIPCVNRNEQEYAFFRKHGLDRIKDINKYGIDVNAIIKTANVIQYTDKPMAVTTSNRTHDTELKITEKRQEIQSMTEGRHKPFFDAAISMRTLGLPLNEIECELKLIAANDSKMKKKVPGIMSSLRNYK